MATTSLARQISSVMANATRNRASVGGSWYTPHMAAASRAITERLPLVDLVLEIRDARIPLSSEYEQLGRNNKSSFRRIIVLNKMDLADRSQTKEWMSYFEQNNCISYGVNAHNKESIKQFLNFVQARVRKLRKNNHSYTTTILLVGIPNVGKSALTNSLHQIGRISAAEKGKLKHATVSPHPGETKDISSLKIGSHPNIYVLDTPGVLPPKISDVEVFSKLALTVNMRIEGTRKHDKPPIRLTYVRHKLRQGENELVMGREGNKRARRELEKVSLADFLVVSESYSSGRDCKSLEHTTFS
ncbi:hypothetical protein TIFTF001_045323 [Ficus carica]|uniref:CP-type G domain-containing protein n=1 Tax=Ficus carica TaxID=3494 RepID=A0AA88CKT9_FICCA|nr:hypothetical protein TIFTF001_045323 [Ficus carica]